MKYLYILLLIPVLFACGEGEELFYEDDVCKIKSWQSYEDYLNFYVYENEEGKYDFKFGLNSFTDVKRVYMDSCSIEGIAPELENATFFYVEKDAEGEMVEKELSGLSCDGDGNITGTAKTAITSIPINPGEVELPTSGVFFRFILDNEASSDTTGFTVYFR